MLLWYEKLIIELVMNKSFEIYIAKNNPAQI